MHDHNRSLRVLLRFACVSAIGMAACAVDPGGQIEGGGSVGPDDFVLDETIDPGDDGGTEPNDEPADDDLSDPGQPAQKRSYLEGLDESQGPGDHFDFDGDSHEVISVDLHGTELVVAIDRSVLVTGDGLSAEAFAAFVESCFHNAWHVFGGYAFDRYAVRIRADDGTGDFSLSPVGITLSGSDYGAPWGLEVVAHEMFHSWNVKFVRPTPNASENLFQWETWVAEGATVYYSFRHMGFALGENEYQNGMNDRWASYEEFVGTENDLSIPDLVAAIGSAPPGDPSVQDPTAMLYARGALVSYLLDVELAEDDVRLDDVLRVLYLDALDGKTWDRSRLVEVLQSLTGRDFDPFLDEWVDSNAHLPLDGAFDLLE